MSSRFHLKIAANHEDFSAEFILSDEAGVQLAYRYTDLKNIPAGHLMRLFDLRDSLHRYVLPPNREFAMAESGVCIAEDVLGAEIFTRIWTAKTPRALEIQIPGTADVEERTPLAGE